uniref:Nucleoside diphosphate kinase n=1 Tax=Diacronema lutheri TaxID=2081491 RepID=A0A7R9YJD1_DIALT
MAGNDERTYIMVKPDGVQRGLVGKIIQRFEDRGFKLVALKFTQPTKQLLEKHYADLKSKPFFPGLVEYMSSGPVVPMVWEGLNAVAMGRKMLGATKPAESEPGTIRGDFCLDVGRNLCHGSDGVEAAKGEIALWFSPDELVSWADHSAAQVYEKPPVVAAAAPAGGAKGKGGGKEDKKGGGAGGKDDKKPAAAAAAAPEDAEKAAKEAAKARDKQMKAAIKEGGKKGVELEGASDMGGLEFFCTSVDTPDGDMEMLTESVKAMNAEPDESAEERKGGAGHIGKMIFSAGSKQLIMVAYVPEDKQAKVSAAEWMKDVCTSVNGRVVGDATKGYAVGEADGDFDKGHFPIKMKDTALAAGIAYLKSKGCFPDTADDSDDEPAFGDDAFDDL